MVRDRSVLTSGEVFWRDHQLFLQQRGYLLRPRYSPTWIPSWLANGTDQFLAEDGLRNHKWNILDAVRIVDNLKVTLKLVPTDTEEIPIARFLSSGDLREDPRNSAVPIMDVLPLPDTDGLAILVMPFLRDFFDPPFRYRIEFIELIRRLLQGLEFMHENNVAHRDACWFNIMMDATNLIPRGFHHVDTHSHDGNRYSKFTYKTRISVAPVQYYFIDFGLSSRFSSFEGRRLVIGTVGQNYFVPEFSSPVPYDPFPIDIYQVGGVIMNLVEIYYGLNIFRPLAMAMMQKDPALRPDASASLFQFENIVSKMSKRKLKGRVYLLTRSFRGSILQAMENRISTILVCPCMPHLYNVSNICDFIQGQNHENTSVA
ncbi:hypothetical protein BU17DRAFT_56469 [Hysterangium stoloniferum]|nr:hypothetical protein BU17DRAFT_56469 [Hysterangium stoloniferum]